MKVSLPKPTAVAVLLASMALAWTGNPRLANTASLENELHTAQQRCVADQQCPVIADGFNAHWVSRTHSGNLFLVIQSQCRISEHCPASFVERTAQGSSTRLNIQGQFRVLHSGKPIPDVQTWRSLSASETEYTLYTWVSGAYRKAETHTAFLVDGVECGTALDCYQAAQRAHAERETGKALKILEQVHNVSFI